MSEGMQNLENPFGPAWQQALGETGDVSANMEAWQKFLQLGLPTRQQEAWKYTSLAGLKDASFKLSPLRQSQLDLESSLLSANVHQALEALPQRLVFVDGVFLEALSSKEILGQELASLKQVSTGSADPESSQGLDLLGQALNGQSLQITVPAKYAAKVPLSIVYLHTNHEEEDRAGFVNWSLNLESQSELIVEEYWGEGALDGVHQEAKEVQSQSFLQVQACIDLQPGARLLHRRLQAGQTHGKEFGRAKLQVTCAQDSTYHNQLVSQLTGKQQSNKSLIRNETRVQMTGPGAETVLDSLYLVDGKSHLDNQTEIVHAAPDCTSHQLYKGILRDASRAVFNGRVVVPQDSQRTVAHQLNRNLMLNDGAEVDTKPELLIDADDVKCSHGASVGQLHPMEQFYLQSRGIPAPQAESMLCKAFAQEVLERDLICFDGGRGLPGYDSAQRLLSSYFLTEQRDSDV